MPDHPEHAHLALEQGGLLKLEQGGYLLLEQNEGDGLYRYRLDGYPPYSFLILDGLSGDLLLEPQPAVSVRVGSAS